MNLQELKDNNIEFVMLRNKTDIQIIRMRNVTEDTLAGCVFSKLRENADGVKDTAEYIPIIREVMKK